MDAYPNSEKNQALYLAGTLAKLLPGARGRPRGARTLDMVLGTLPSAKGVN
jgi:hypothetical protein